MFLMPARAVTQNYKMTLKTSVFKGSFLIWRGGSSLVLTLLGLKYLPGWVKFSVAFPVAYAFNNLHQYVYIQQTLYLYDVVFTAFINKIIHVSIICYTQ